MADRTRFVPEDYPDLTAPENREKFLRNLNAFAETANKKFQPGGQDLGSLAGFTKEITIGGGKAAIAAASPDTAWHTIGGGGEPAFGAGITNTGAPYPSCRFMRDAGGTVFVQLAYNRSAGNGSTVFVLPAGYRPSGKLEFASNSNGVQRTTVLADGTVVTDYATANPIVVSCVFPAEDYTPATGTSETSAFPIRFKNELGKSPAGIAILGAWNTTTSGKEAPVSVGSPAWSLADGQIVLHDVSGLLPGKKYRLTIRVFG